MERPVELGAARRIGIAVATLALAMRTTDACAATYSRRVITTEGLPRGAMAPRDAKLDTQLRRLSAPDTVAGGRPSTFAVVDGAWRRGDRVRVQAVLGAGTDPGDLARHGLVVERTAGDVVEGTVAIADLARLADLDVVRALRPSRPGRLRAVSVDTATRADLARATSLDGTGVVVGVISDGLGSLPTSIVPDGCDAGSGAEGQALIEIVHTLAPGATVRFASGIVSAIGFIDAVHCLHAAGAQVIVDDLGFFDQPYFSDGSIAQAVRAAVQAGVSYHSAAGNEATSHYGASFRATTGSTFHDFASSGPADNYDEIELAPGEEVDCVLQWSNAFGAAMDDYDLTAYDMGTSPPTLVVASTNPQTGTQDPLEYVALVNIGTSTAVAGVAIDKVSGNDAVLGVFCFGGSLPEYLTPAGSVVGHPAVAEVVAVGAVDLADPALGVVESYSSQGPVSIYVPSVETRAKPDVVGFDGVSSTTPGFEPFYGTSAAAPDSAAIAALMLQKNGCRTPAQIQQALASSAIDIGAPGVDSIAGAGRVDALGAVTDVPPPTCTADADCDDGNSCTADACEGCSCEHRDACNDGDPCTADSCDATAGCSTTPSEGFDGVACLCGRDLDRTCGSSLPRAIVRQFQRGCGLVTRASQASNGRRARRLLQRAVAAFRRAGRRMSVAQRRSDLGAACSELVDATLGDARRRTQRLGDGL